MSAKLLHKGRRHYTLSMAFCCLTLLTGLIHAQSVIDFGYASQNPNTVGAQSASLSISFKSPVQIPGKSTITVTVPPQTQLKEAGVYVNCQLRNDFENAAQLCQTIGTQQISYVLPEFSSIFANSYQEITFESVFRAPYSTKATDPFKVEVTAEDGEVLLIDNNQIVLNDLDTGASQVKVSQLNSLVVGQPTAAIIEVTTTNQIPATGGVQLIFRKWNDRAGDGARLSYILDRSEFTVDQNSPIAGIQLNDLLIDYNELCSPMHGVDTTMTCSHYSTETFDYITIIDMFSQSNGREAGDTFRFYITRLRNPISETPVDIEVKTFTSVLEVQGGQSFFAGEIDKGYGPFKPTHSAAIKPADCEVRADDHTVQEFSVFYMSFKVPVPVNEGCILTIQLPQDFKLSAGDLAGVKGWGLFGRKTQLSVGIDETNNTIKIVNQCVSYTAADVKTELELTTIQNPFYVKKTQSFTIEVQDAQAGGIAIIETDVFYMPSAGTVTDINIFSVNEEIKIEQLVDVQLDFTPKHAVKGISYILMKLPEQMKYICNIASAVGVAGGTCSQTGNYNELRFDNPFPDTDNKYPGNEPLTIVFHDRVLPGANLMIKGIEIRTYMSIEGVDYLVDSLLDDTKEFFAPEQQLFLKSNVLAASDEVYTETRFTLVHVLNNNVPANAILHIRIPPELEVKDIASVEGSCAPERNLQETLTCTLVKNDSDDSHQLTVLNAFPDTGLSRQQAFALAIHSGMYTPLSMKTTESFHVVITDKDGHEINYIRRALALTMKNGKDVGPIQLTTGSELVGDYTHHQISFLAPAPIYDGFLITVNIPEECDPPMQQDFVCTTQYPLQETGFDQNCKINGQRVTVTVQKSDTYIGERIAMGERIWLKFSQIKNPQSTAPSQTYAIEVKTDFYQIVAVQRTVGAKVQNSIPAVVNTAEFEALDLKQLAVTTVTINWVNTQVYPESLSVLIEYDPNEIEPAYQPDFPPNTVPCIVSRTLTVNCEYLTDRPGFIRVSNLLQAEQSPGMHLQLTLTNQLIKVVTPLTTRSWKMTTYTDATTTYSIDQVASGLTFTFTCNLPCLECTSDPDYCLSCNMWEGNYLILYEGKCYDECPVEWPIATYREAWYSCKPCDEKCKTCGAKNGKECTSCFGGYSEYPFLYGSTCVNQCIHGLYGDRQEAECLPCNAPCETCSESADTCLSCIMPDAGEEISLFYHENQCKNQCPDGWVADRPTRSNVCEPCSDNCATCFGTKDQCATCKPGMKLNSIDETCVSECPYGVTVLQTDPSGKAFCQECDSSCVTCRGSPDYCTTCQDNLSLATNGVCKLECDEASLTEVSLNGQCVGCSSSCATCQHTQDHCLSCVPGTFLYANSCVTECPVKNGYQYVPNDQNQCVIPGLICKFGWELIPTGDGCTLKARICEPPNNLNFDGTSCVPGSGSWIYFPLLSVCVFVTIIVAIAKWKSRETRFVANLIVFWSIVEFIGMLYVWYLAYDFGIAPMVYMMLFAVLLAITINLFFYIVFVKMISQDITFRHWVSYNKCNVRTISIFGMIFSFKIYRLLYSKFFGAKRFDAPFEDPYKFFTPLNLASFVHLLVVKLVYMVACIFGIAYVPMKYQLLMQCYEGIAMEIILLIFYVWEYCQMRNTLLKRKASWKVDAKQVDRMKVMGGFDDDLSEDDQDPDEYMTKEGTHLEKVRKELKPKALKTIHTMEKVMATLLVKRKALEDGYENTRQEIENLHEKELMLRNRRRCMSFRIERPDFQEAWGFDSDDECDQGQNFISEPGSPRSKEMLQNPYFVTRMQALNRIYHMRDQFDNCYAEARDPSVWPLRDVEKANKKLQTNVMELLGVDDLVADTQTQMSCDEPQMDEYEYDPAQTAHLINGVIARIDDDSPFDNYASNSALMRRKGSDPNAENYGSGAHLPPRGDGKASGSKGKRKRKRLTRRRMAELPNFDVDEILGEFESDPSGNQIVLQTANGKLNDKYGRLVNRRGYLIDPNGNVVTRGNVFIFYKEEVDFDDEIPAPYCFQKSKTIKYTVKNFSTHRRMRKKDKLAMQDEFIEREYLKLKQAARTKGGVVSQQNLQIDQMGLNQSERVHGGNSSTGHKGLSSHLGHINSSGTALLGGEHNNSQRLGDANLSNIILHDRTGNELFGDSDGLNADVFIAQNTTQVKRKPPSSRHSVHKQSIDPDDDDFINEVTEPMQAKTKAELLDASAPVSEKRQRSRQHSSRSRSRSKSKDGSYRSSKKGLNFNVKNSKMLNDESHRSLDKAEASDQHQSAAEMMAMPTAGGGIEQETQEEHALRNLDFDNRKFLNNSSSMNLNNRKSKRSALSGGKNSRAPSANHAVYDNEMRSHKERKTAVVNDEEFLKKMQQFNSYLDKKKIDNQRRTRSDHPGLAGQGSSGIIDDTFLNPDGSVRQVGLAHKNLNSVYGRVRTKFNQQIREGGTALKFRPQGSSYRNRVDEPRRIIAGMSYGQRERMLQLEINKLIDNNTDELSQSNIKQKLNYAVDAYNSSLQQSTTPKGGKGASLQGQRRQRDHDGKLNELRGIYSDYRLDGAARLRGGQSPRSHANNLTLDASKLLANDLRDAQYQAASRQVDQDLRKVQDAVHVYAADAKSSNKSTIDHHKQNQKSNRTVQPTAVRPTPNDILHGKYL